MSCGFGLWGSSFSTNPAFAVDLSALPTPAIRSQARHVVSDQLSAKHPTPAPALFDSSEATSAYGFRGVLHNIEVLSSFAEFGFDDPEKKCMHVKLLRDQLCNSLVVGEALKHNVVPLMASLLKDSDVKVVAAAASVLERLATVRIGRVQVVSENVSLSLAGLLSHSDKSVRSAAIAALRVASDSIEGRRTLASCDDVAMLLTQSLCCTDPVDAASEAGIQTVQALTNMVKEDRATSVAIAAGLMPMICKLLVAYNPKLALSPHGKCLLESLLVLVQNVAAWSAAKLALVSAGVISALLPFLEVSQELDLQRLACSALALILVCIPGKKAAQPLCEPLVALLSSTSQREIYVNAKQALKSACEEAKFRETCAAMLRESVPDELEDITCGRA